MSEEKFETATKKSFERWAPYYDSSFFDIFYFSQIRKKILALVEQYAKNSIAPHAYCLDAASGTGKVVAALGRAYPSAKFIGVDFSGEMIKRARERIANNIPNVNFAEANVTQMPFGEGTFDFVVCSDSFHHFANPVAALQEIRRVSKKGAIFLLVDPARDTRFQKICLGIFGTFFETPKKYYSREEISDMLGKSGFTISAVTNFYLNNFYIALTV